MRVHEPLATDREQREALEQLQAELAAVRLELAAARAKAGPAMAALEDAVARARTRRDQAQDRLAQLTAEQVTLTSAVTTLDAQVAKKQKEDAVLALGARRGGKQLDWGGRTDSQRLSPIAMLVLAVLFGTILLLLAVFAPESMGRRR
jgi:chromosome segregation ATPase